jgi:predicted RNA-binding Zn-ribbon protein involved in translation (DUF1610 family)
MAWVRRASSQIVKGPNMPIEPGELDRMTGRMWTSSLPPVCPRCGYNLTGSVSKRCPECGGVFRMKDLRRGALDAQRLLEEARRADHAARGGLMIVGLGVALFLLGKLLGGYGSEMLGRICGLVCGFVAVFLGMSVFRVARIPEWAQDHLESQPSRTLAAVTVLSAVGLSAVSIIGW